MFLPYIQKTKTLALLALIQIFLLCFVKLSSSPTYKKHLDAQDYLDAMIISICNSNTNEIDLEECNLLGDINTPYTSKGGDEYSKRITLKKIFPNVFIDYFNSIGLQPGDTIAVAMTGSFPGASLAMYAASKTLGIHPVVISSVGSSAYGANTEDLSIIDIEDILFKQEYINNRSIAASLGGKNDKGNYLLPSTDKKDSSRYNYMINKIKNLDIELINQSSLLQSIEDRIRIYSSSISGKYKAYINIGGGAASLGLDSDTLRYMPSGIIINNGSKNYTIDGVASKFLNNKIPIINIQDITTIQSTFDIDPGSYIYDTAEYSLNDFIKKSKLNPYIVICAWILSVFSIIFIGYQSFKQIKERMKDIEPESLL
tara:strand:- start:139 stop:1251 length:1113 start_codon:yes stop_codon:yes gene_type:complete